MALLAAAAVHAPHALPKPNQMRPVAQLDRPDRRDNQANPVKMDNQDRMDNPEMRVKPAVRQAKAK